MGYDIKTDRIPMEQVESMLWGMGSPSYCSACGDLDEFGGCEPDAHGYFCDMCETHNKMGLEQAIMCGRLDVVGDAPWLEC